MRLKTIAAAALMMLTAACERASAGRATRAPLSTREVATGFLKQMLGDGDMLGAYERYTVPHFKQHDPNIADGLAGYRAYVAESAKGAQGDPKAWVNVNNMILVDGDFFVLHHHLFKGPDDPGRMVMDLWRLEHGKIVEHWDIVQAIPRVMAHANGMACGQGDDYRSAKRLGNTIAHPTCGLPDPAANREESLKVLDAYTAEFWKSNVTEPILRWFASNYRQHSPAIADGVEGAIAYLQGEFGRGQDKMPKFGPVRMIAEGDFVLSHRLVTYYGARSLSANVDIFRIIKGKISEHWDLRQDVPETAKNANGMW